MNPSILRPQRTFAPKGGRTLPVKKEARLPKASLIIAPSEQVKNNPDFAEHPRSEFKLTNTDKKYLGGAGLWLAAAVGIWYFTRK